MAPPRASRLVALAALQAAVTVSWMAYAYYQPRLLAHFGFESLAGILSWYLVFAGTTLAPLAGDASDRLVRSGGDRFPVVRAGVALAATCFVAVALTGLAEGGSPVRFVLPLFVAIWIAGMTIFQAPALAIVRDVSGERPVTPSMPPLVAATTLPQAAWPWLEGLLAQLGGPVTFLAGGIAVVGTALALGRTVDVRAPEKDATVSGSGGGTLPRAFACGIASAFVVLLAIDVVPTALSARAGMGITTLAAIAAATSALAAPVAVRAGAALGNGRALVAGLVVTVLCYPVATSTVGLAGGIVVATVMGLALALHLATALPFALSGQSAGRAGLATGLYLGGAAVGSRLVGLLVSP